MLADHPASHDGWGRVILYVDDVDVAYRAALDTGHSGAPAGGCGAQPGDRAAGRRVGESGVSISMIRTGTS